MENKHSGAYFSNRELYEKWQKIERVLIRFAEKDKELFNELKSAGIL